MNENDTFEELKIKLLKTKNQKKRREILGEYENKFEDKELINRYNLLLQKASIRPIFDEICAWALIISIVLLVGVTAIIFIFFTLAHVLNISLAQEIYDFAWDVLIKKSVTIGVIMSIFSIPLFIVSRALRIKKKHCLNIKNI